jgi:TPR repeat protein
MRRLFLPLALGLALAMPAAADLADGIAAMERGDHAAAAAAWRPLAEAGQAEAQARLGFLYEKGRGVAQDPGRAARWYRAAAEQGHATGQYSLGRLYELGHGVARDAALALAWYREAARQGHAKGRYKLGLAHAGGAGVVQDYREAVKWLGLAADQGYQPAARLLSALAEHGRADGGDEGGTEALLGALHEGASGAPRDLVRAHAWYARAAARGDEAAAAERDRVAAALTPAELRAARALAREWARAVSE